MSVIIEDFIDLAKVHAGTDYSNAASVTKANAAVELMNLMAVEFNESGRTEEFLGLVSHPTAGAWVAFSVAELAGISTKQKELCISKIKTIAVGTSLDSMGAEYWLKDRGHDNS
jgi:hypothetical protein